MLSRLVVVLLLSVISTAACREDAHPAAVPSDASDANQAKNDLAIGSAGYALSFDGLDDYATCGNGGFPPASDEQTISLWVKYSAGQGTQTFIAMRKDFEHGIHIGIRDGSLAVWRTSNRAVLVRTSALPAAGQWHHVTYVFDRTEHRLYVDEAPPVVGTAASDVRTPSTVWLGTFDGSHELYTGQLDEVRVWSIVRSDEEIQADGRHRLPGSERGLVAYWTFDAPAWGGTSFDASGHGNHVTLGDGIPTRMPSRVGSDAPAGP